MAVQNCPKCSKATSGSYSGWVWIFAICAFPIGLVAFLANKNFHCRACGHRW